MLTFRDAPRIDMTQVRALRQWQRFLIWSPVCHCSTTDLPLSGCSK
jgi:hypothetical protein